MQRAIPILCIRSSLLYLNVTSEEMKIVEVERCCISSIQTLLFDSSLCAASASHFSIEILLMHMFTSSDTCLTLSSFYLSEHVIVVNRNYDLLDLRMSKPKLKPEAKTRKAVCTILLRQTSALERSVVSTMAVLTFRYHWDNAFYASPYLMDENETEMGESQ